MKDSISFPKGIFFDMDGVLLLTTQRSAQSWQLVGHHFAPLLGLSPWRLTQALAESRQAYAQEIAHDAHKQQRDRLEPFATRREMVERALAQVGKRERALASAMVRSYERLRKTHRRLAPFAHETLQALRDRGLRLALLSNGNARYQRQKIAHHRLAPLFDAIWIEEEVGIAKPDPRIFLMAMERFALSAHEVWMVGDDLARDIAASQHLGLFAIWCDSLRRGVPDGQVAHPDRIIHTLPEILLLLQEALPFH
ncbi:MAG TPA: HAD family hydrolase [Ktedonobacteraceae bacterium]|nr:HAD family hydrolase [Ktedonobacteraceae bacterium]